MRCGLMRFRRRGLIVLCTLLDRTIANERPKQ
jgi:hypothetical protein